MYCLKDEEKTASMRASTGVQCCDTANMLQHVAREKESEAMPPKMPDWDLLIKGVLEREDRISSNQYSTR